MKKKISYAEHKHKMEYCEICDNWGQKEKKGHPNMVARRKEQEKFLENHVCTCKKNNKKAGKDIYSCFKCQKPLKKSKYHYWETYQIFRQKCWAHSEVPEKEIFQKFMVENLKEVKND